MSEVLRALEGPIAPMFCASDDPEHATICDRIVPLHGQPALGPRPRRHHRRPRIDDPRRPRARERAGRRSRRRRTDTANGALTHTVTDQTQPTDQHLVIRDLRVAPVAKPEPGDPPGHRPDRRQGRGPRDHGPQRLGQDDARLRADGPPGLRGQRRRGPLEGPRPPQAVARTSARASACSSPSSTRRRSPACPSRASSGRRSTPSSRASTRIADIDPTDPVKGGISMRDFRNKMREKMALLRDGRGLRQPLRQRGLLGRREEAPRDAPDGRPRARDGDPRRDRLRPRHRRAADRGRGRQRDAQPEPRRAADHPLPAPAQLHQARLRPRAGRRAGSSRAAARTSRCGSRKRATARSCARPASRRTSPTRRCSCRKGPELESTGTSPRRPPASRADDPWRSRRPRRPALIEAHVERFNAGVRSGDFGPMVAAFDPRRAARRSRACPVGPFEGRDAIADRLPRPCRLTTRSTSSRSTSRTTGPSSARYAWKATGDTGTMTLTHDAGSDHRR